MVNKRESGIVVRLGGMLLGNERGNFVLYSTFGFCRHK